MQWERKYYQMINTVRIDGDYSLQETKTRDVSASTLKIIAIILMMFDHLFVVFLDHDTVIGMVSRITGRVVAPIMCYLIAEGYFHTRDVKKYISRLFAFSVISHFPYVLAMGGQWWKMTSVFWSLTLGLVALVAVKKENLDNWKKVVIVGICCAAAVPANWNYIGVLWILCFGVFRGQFKTQMACMVVIGYFFNFLPFFMDMDWGHFYQAAIVLAIPLLALYKGRRGYSSKVMAWGFYIFYPAHLLLIYALKRIFLS